MGIECNGRVGGSNEYIVKELGVIDFSELESIRVEFMDCSQLLGYRRDVIGLLEKVCDYEDGGQRILPGVADVMLGELEGKLSEINRVLRRKAVVVQWTEDGRQIRQLVIPEVRYVPIDEEEIPF